MEDPHDQNRIPTNLIEDAVLPVTPAAQSQSGGLVDLPGAWFLAQERESIRQSGIVFIASRLAVNRRPVRENVE